MKYNNKIKDSRLTVRIKLSASEKVNEREFASFSQRQIRGLLKPEIIRKWGKTSIKYTGPIGVSLYERMEKPITKYDFLFIMEQIVDISQKLQMNAMSLNKIIWDIHQVYVNEITREVQFLYLPLEKSANEQNVLGFINDVIYAVHPEADQNSEYLSRFVYFMKGLREFDPARIEKFILNEEKSVVKTIKSHYTGQSGFMTDKPKDYYEHYDNDDEKTDLLDEELTEPLDEEVTGLLSEQEDTMLLDNSGEGTVLLRQEQRVHCPVLYRIRTEEKICINKRAFRIGNEQNYADYFVSDNDAVSRRHANIIIREKRCFVVDLGSTNGTYINDQSIPDQQEIEIHDGDRLRLADEEFIFYH